MSIDNIRNIALLGQSGAGKTTLSEQLLFHTGTINTLGELSRGTTVSDFDAEERALQKSIDTSWLHFEHQCHQVNVLDTPGSADFIGRAISVLPAVESCALVVDATEGVSNVAEKLFQTAGERKKCRMVIINKIDSDAEHLATLLDELQTRLGPTLLPINLPVASGDDVIDCYFDPQYDRTPAFSSVESAHDALIDQVVELDEALMELYLEQGSELKPEQLHDPFEKALRQQHLVPVCFVSARTGAGVDALLQVLAELMPTPLEGNPPLFMNYDNPVTLSPEPGSHAIAHVFKVVIDPFMGRLALARVHQGRLKPDSALFIGDGRKPFKPGHLFRLQGKERAEVSQADPGDWVAIAKIDALAFDSVIHDSHDEDHFHLQSLTLPPPMFSMAIKPSRRGEEQKLWETLDKITAEDPSLSVSHKASLNETLLTGVGEFHLKTAINKMRNQYKLAVETSTPSIDYRETITVAADGHYRHKKQTGGAGQFGEVHLSVKPLSRGEGFRFVDKVVGGAIPGQFIPAVEKGVRQILEEGAIAGYPMQDLQVTVIDGKHHSVDSKEIAFVAAGRKAFIEAVAKAKPVVLEPIVDLAVTVPADAMGDVSADMASHRGVITDTHVGNSGRTTVHCKSPLSEVSDYSQRLKSITKGEGHFTLALSHFEPVPVSQQKALCQGYRSQELA
ncbi:elongation factor G [Corallincola luteus]|uniref:Elongation factor G n=1 Tax=Corallincola luteus TaxID=1775177 RepID=A0ABY2AL25_9GAMM|nr:elongation factor G [Corallincola luteus]TCI02168.1 elongation factor G [Corallincola luteus]